MSRLNAQTAMPPSRPAIIAMKVSSGSITSSANRRGSTSRSIGSRPSVRIASISSRLCIAPICAVNALAVRPASRIAVSSTPNSRRKAMPTSSTTKISAPKSRSMVAPRKAITAPTMKRQQHHQRHRVEADLFHVVHGGGQAEAARLREHAHQLEQVLAEEADQRDDFAASCPPPRSPGAAERGGEAVFALLLRAVVGDVLDRRDQRVVVVAESERVEIECRCAGRSAAAAARRPNPAGRPRWHRPRATCSGAVRSASPIAGGVLQRPAAAQAQPRLVVRSSRVDAAGMVLAGLMQADLVTRATPCGARIQSLVADTAGKRDVRPVDRRRHGCARGLGACDPSAMRPSRPCDMARVRAGLEVAELRRAHRLRGRTGRAPARLRHHRAAPGRRDRRGRARAGPGLRTVVQPDRHDPDLQRSASARRRVATPPA